MVRASRRKFHYIYKTTCTVTGRYYIGMHSTDDLDDGYMGSGKRLWNSIRKHGRDAHVCEILEQCSDRQALVERERELVTEKTIKDPQCMNLRIGGEGGWDHCNTPGQWKGKSNFHLVDYESRNERRRNKIQTDVEFRKRYGESISRSLKEHYQTTDSYWSGKTHSVETKAKMAAAKKGRNCGAQNPNFGTCWITKDGSSIRIHKSDLEQYLSDGWARGRKITTLKSGG